MMGELHNIPGGFGLEMVFNGRHACDKAADFIHQSIALGSVY